METAFLHGVLGEGEEVYMDCPEGLDHEEDECLLLLKTLYGLKQLARTFFLTLTKVMMEARFQPSKRSYEGDAPGYQVSIGHPEPWIEAGPKALLQ